MRKTRSTTTLNAVCPYFTMFPLSFPLRILASRATDRDWVLDPFSGRGTTNYAARLLGIPSIGVDSSPVAVALTDSKLATTTAAEIAEASRDILSGTGRVDTPRGDFWSWAFHSRVLSDVCRLREALIADCSTAARRALRAVVMGALHGPRTKSRAAYLSNQCTRTYAPKPRYATEFWRTRELEPPDVDVQDVIERRSKRYYDGQPPATGFAISGDSRDRSTFRALNGERVRWIVTSPPYYGMRTYVPDQWLRHWFAGGPSEVDYSNDGQMSHGDPEAFAEQLRRVWSNVATVAVPDACLVVRFGGIADRKVDHLAILKRSFDDSPWVLTTVRPAGSASSGRRQAIHFAGVVNTARTEHDAWARIRS